MVAEWKKKEVAELKKLIKNHRIFGIVNIDDIPAPQMQRMKRSLSDQLTLRVARNTLIKRALGKNKAKGKLEGNNGFIFTDMDSFKLYKALEKGKTPAPAKSGDIAPRDIVIEKGDTGFPPGPMIGELQGVGVPAQVQKGTIHIKKDTVVAKEGEVISKKLADVLTKLKMEPMEIGLDLVASCEDGVIFLPDVLRVDEDEIRGNVMLAHTSAMNLALFAGIPTKETVSMLIGKSYRDAVSLAVELSVVSKDTVKILLDKAYRDALAVSSQIDEVK
jgi:large subunit ribosomal protein L10